MLARTTLCHYSRTSFLIVDLQASDLRLCEFCFTCKTDAMLHQAVEEAKLKEQEAKRQVHEI